ncbi:hypothetical protein PanWU01x14_047000 [Parasponia andersonii]|uniref:Uncharacterized protein n=1 Tax=Parasponia andersonii TaxID=3476 RepID=A0A2P5DNW4_PARAD|nr:hypothetical protein PanWU01x14_047000 [Parasponia andersonii]
MHYNIASPQVLPLLFANSSGFMLDSFMKSSLKLAYENESWGDFGKRVTIWWLTLSAKRSMSVTHIRCSHYHTRLQCTKGQYISWKIKELEYPADVELREVLPQLVKLNLRTQQLNLGMEVEEDTKYLC